MKLYQSILGTLLLVVAPTIPTFADTITVSSYSNFLAATAGQTTTNFNGVAPLTDGAPTCPGSGACSAGFLPLVVNGTTFIATNVYGGAGSVTVNSANYYGPTDLPNQYAVNASGVSSQTLTIGLATPVTAFGLNFGTLFNSSSVSFTIANNNYSLDTPFEALVANSTVTALVSAGIDASGRITNGSTPAVKTLAISSDAATLLSQLYVTAGVNSTLAAFNPGDTSVLHLTNAQVKAVVDWMLGGQIGPSPILPLLNSGLSATVNNTLSTFRTQFLGFISTDPFDAITLSVPNDASWVVSDFTTADVLTTAVPEASTWAMVILGFCGLALMVDGRKRLIAA